MANCPNLHSVCDEHVQSYLERDWSRVAVPRRNQMEAFTFMNGAGTPGEYDFLPDDQKTTFWISDREVAFEFKMRFA